VAKGISSKRLTITTRRSPSDTRSASNIIKGPGPLIQAIEGFVQHQQLGSPQQGPGQQQLAPLPAREIAIGALPQDSMPKRASSAGLMLLPPASSIRVDTRYPASSSSPSMSVLRRCQSSSPAVAATRTSRSAQLDPIPLRHTTSSPHRADASAVLPLPLLPTKAQRCRGETEFGNNQGVVATQSRGGGLPLQ
jgi:hypothetical protein